MSKRRLQDRVASCWSNGANHRAAHERIFKAYIGDTHGLSSSTAERIPLNGHALYARSMLQYLAANQPKVLISTDVGPWKPYTEGLEYHITQVMKEEMFGYKQQRWVLNALLYSPGILKVCREFVRVPTEDGEYMEVLRTVVANVDRSDWVYDTSASSVYDAEFVGHRMRVSIDDVLANPLFEGVDEGRLRGMAGHTIHDGERLFFEQDDASAPYHEKVALWEIYDRTDGRLKIFPVDGSDVMLCNEAWDGHPLGPLHYLDFLDVPNHVVGLSPLCVLHDLIEATNRSLSKAIKQTDAAKTIMRIVGGNKAEAEAVMEALDGQAVYQDGGGVAEMLSVGGPDPRTLAMVPVLRDLYNWLGGDIAQLGRAIAGAPTATQGQGLEAAAGGLMSFMQNRTVTAVRGAVEAMMWYELKDDIAAEQVPTQLADGQTHWESLGPEIRQRIDPILLNVDIDVYSMRYKSPESRLNTIMQWWNGVAVPGYQIWKAQDGEYDMQVLNRTYAKLVDEPVINEIALYSMRPHPEQTGTGGIIPSRPEKPAGGGRRQPETDVIGEVVANLESD